MTGHMVIFRGLPGSGKTTMAKQLQMTQTGNGWVLGRDHIRAMMGIEGVGNLEEERQVTELQSHMIATGLMNGYTVYVDDTNLKSQYVRRLISLAHRYGSTHHIIDITHVSPEECYHRVANRSRVVPLEIISGMYSRYIKGKGYPLPVPEVEVGGEDLATMQSYEPDPSKPLAILVDVDGTVADHTGIRGHHEYDKVFFDRPKYDVIRAVMGLARFEPMMEINLIFVSGRPESCRVDTARWLEYYVTGPHESYQLFMRADGDHRPDWKVKLEIFNREFRDNYYVIGSFDDRNQVVDMYRRLGLTVFQVAEGAF